MSKTFYYPITLTDEQVKFLTVGSETDQLDSLPTSIYMLNWHQPNPVQLTEVGKWLAEQLKSGNSGLPEFKPFTVDDVTFVIGSEPDLTDPATKLISGDPEKREAELAKIAEIERRLEWGDVTAWFGITITAEHPDFPGLRGHASTWGITYDSEGGWKRPYYDIALEDPKELDYIQHAAVEDLNEYLSDLHDKLLTRITS